MVITGTLVSFLSVAVYIFKPSATKYKLSKSDATMQFGIFLGYRFASGDHWKGEYLVADLSDFANQPLAR